MVSLDTEGSPKPFCMFVAFFDTEAVLNYGMVPIRVHHDALSVNDLKFQAGVGWNFRPAVGNEIGIDYDFVGPDGTMRKVPFTDGMTAEKNGKTVITIARMATADQMRKLMNGDTLTFIAGKRTFEVLHEKRRPLHAAVFSKDKVTQTDGIFHLADDTLPAYQNFSLEQILTRQCVPVRITEVSDDQFFLLELVDATGGMKAKYNPVFPGDVNHQKIAKPLVRITPKKGEGSTIDLPTTALELSDVQEFLQSLVEEKLVIYAAHNKSKEETDLAIVVTNDSFDLGKKLEPVMEAARLKSVGSAPVFYALASILKMISPSEIVVCGQGGPNLRCCADTHSLPVEVCVLSLLYALLEDLTEEEFKNALRASIETRGDDQTAKVHAALHSLTMR